MKKLLVGMSGGVDSSAAAYLLKQQGYEVTGATLLLRDGQDAAAEREVNDARRAAEAIGIPHVTLDFREAFRREVIGRFIREYQEGRTPNPCIVCNRYVKWECLLRKAAEMGADGIATGHYARVKQLENGRFALAPSAGDLHTSKDQTYALYRLTQEQLSRTRMPLGEYTKDGVRQIAREAGIPVADKPDSQEICFIPDHDYAAFIEHDTGRRFPPGHFVVAEGHVLGEHRGIIRYTVGQRKHLGIALGKRMFVREIRPLTNEVVLADDAELYQRSFRAGDLHFMSVPDLTEPAEVFAKIRYNHAGAPAVIVKNDDRTLTCTFTEPQRAITPGQAAVFYRDGVLLGGGTIL